MLGGSNDSRSDSPEAAMVRGACAGSGPARSLISLVANQGALPAYAARGGRNSSPWAPVRLPSAHRAVAYATEKRLATGAYNGGQT